MTPVNRFLINPVRELARQGKLAGILLILATVLSILLANGSYAASYLKLWDTEIGFGFLHKSILHWINDGLMVVFFLLVGLEIRREVAGGELSSVKQAVLPVFAAVGGMVMPALIYLAFNAGSPESMKGWAIPTATDIAFSLGILSLLGRRVPLSLKIFLTALAIIDDIGAILIIALFYSHGIQLTMLGAAAVVFLAMLGMNRMKVRQTFWYLVPGLLLWYFILKSGIHPTIAGVLAAFTLPIHSGEELEEQLSRPVNYMILPLFALANTAIPLSFDLESSILSTVSLGILFGLFIGKPLGIVVFFYLPRLFRMRINTDNILSFRQITGLGLTAGIGFTMSIFISSLSFEDPYAWNTAKLAVIAGSVLAALAGMMVLSTCPECPETEEG